MWIFIGLCILFVIVLVLFPMLLKSESREISSFIGRKRVLLITAHPDDECMFFGPTVLALTSNRRCQLVLLCLSEGNYYQQGDVRREELIKSASMLGLHSSDVVLINDRELPDSPSVEWNEDIIGNHILEAIEQHGIETVITFDESGVSGHPNHIALYRAVRSLHKQGRFILAGVSDVLLLETTGILRKYISSLDMSWSVVFARFHSACDWNGYFKGRRAMQEHRSQYLWFRKLYVLFSRYMFVNTFRKL